MGVTIDSLQIEIQSSSTNAAKGIDDLSKSLGNLKKNGAFKTVSTNLTHLSEALKGLPNVHGASNSLRTLANSIEKLKSVGTISNLSNSIAKLPAALKSLESINLVGTASQIRSVVDAMEPLTQLKGSGFSSMVNAMGKIEKVTESLDTQKITAFAAKIKELSAAVEPFATKMGTIQSAFNGLNTAIKQTNVSIDTANTKVNVTAFNFSNMANVVRTVYSAIQSVVQGFAKIVHSASEWDGIAARFGRGFGAQAQETYEWIQRLNKEMGINVQVAMQHSSIYANMLTGFGVVSEDASKMALGYTELTYDIWAGYNDIYKTYEEAAEAIRSAIAGEVEPIRRAGFTIIESTLEQTAANHGLEISLANATEAQKSYLRYLTLVDQAHAQNLVGTYAKEMNTAEGMMRTFSQQLKSLTQAFGSLFLPVLVKVMPYLQAFVELLTEGVRWLGGLLGVEIQDIGKTWGDFNKGSQQGEQNIQDINKELEKSQKEIEKLKNATLGIDELNVISPNASSGSGSGSGSGGGSGSNGFDGLDIDSLWNETIFDTIQSDVDAIKEKLKDWLPVIGGVATALAGLKLTNLLEDVELANFKLSNLGKAVSLVGITIAVGKLVWDFTGAYLEGGDEADLLKVIGTTALGVALAGYLAGKPGASFTLLVSGVVTLSRLAVEIGEGSVEWNDTESIITGIVGGIETAIGAVFTWKTFAPMIKAAWPKIVAAASPALAAVAPYAGLIAAAVGGIILAFVDYDFTDVGHTIGEKIGSALRTAWNWGVEGFKKLFDIDSIWDYLLIVLFPAEGFRRILPKITEGFENISQWIDEKIENLKGNINEFFGGFFDGLFDGLGLDMSWAKKITDLFDIEYLDIVEMVVNPSSIGKHIMTGINKGIDSNAKLSAIKDKLSSMWTEAKTWWDTKKAALASYTPTIGNISTKISSAWTSAKTWWDTKKSSLKSYTPSIGSIYEKVKERWDNAREWWNNKKSAMKSYTPSIGSIYEKVSERWKNAREWWNNKKGSMSYTPSIGSIVDKIKSAWNTAKTWWNNNVKLSIPSLSFKVTYSNSGLNLAQKAIIKALDLDGWPKLSFAANGGIFDQGSLIWAGERGPEVMATAAGGKTGVMNVQQMQDAVYEGVYAAVSAAMRGNGGGGSQEVRVYIDGREVSNVVKKYARESGASIIGNEVYGY